MILSHGSRSGSVAQKSSSRILGFYALFIAVWSSLRAREWARTGVRLTVTVDKHPTMAGFVAGDRGSMDVDD